MRIKLLLFFLVFIFNLLAEDLVEKNPSKQEIKIDLAYLFVPYLKAEYEYLLSEESSCGTVGLLNLGSNANLELQILGFWRWYFNEEFVSGTFIECHVGVTCSEKKNKHNYTMLGAGVALGYKFVTPKGVILDIFAGLGRSIGDVQEQFYPRLGLCLGKRF